MNKISYSTEEKVLMHYDDKDQPIAIHYFDKTVRQPLLADVKIVSFGELADFFNREDKLKTEEEKSLSGQEVTVTAGGKTYKLIDTTYDA